MSRKPIRGTPGPGIDQDDLYLREDVVSISDPDALFSVLQQAQQTHRDLEALVEITGSGLIGSPENLQAFVDRANALVEEWHRLEIPVAGSDNDDGTVSRGVVQMEAENLYAYLRDAVVKWQEAEHCLTDWFSALTDGVINMITVVDRKGHGLLPEFMALYVLGIAGRPDSLAPCVTYIVKLIPGDPQEFTVWRYSAQRARAEKWYRQALRALSEATIASRDHRNASRLFWLTVVLVALTVALVFLTAVLLIGA